jgi:hypothetical protein
MSYYSRFRAIDMPASFCNHGSQFEGLSLVGSQPAGHPPGFAGEREALTS